MKNTGFATVALYTEYLLGMVTGILVARELGPHGFGAYSLAVWLVAVATTVANAGSASGVIKFIAELRGAGTPELIAPVLALLRRVQRWFLASVLVAGAGVLLLGGDDLVPEVDHRLLFGLLAVSTVLRAGYMFNVGIAKGFEHFRASAIIALVATPANLCMVVVACVADAPVTGFLLVFTASSALFWLVSWRQVAPLVPSAEAPPALPPALRARVMRHMRITAVMTIVTYLTASEVEVLFLTLLDTAAAAGVFKVAYQLADGATLLVPGVFGLLLLPMMARALSEGAEVAARRFAAATVYLALLSAPLLAYGLLFADFLIRILYGSAWVLAGPAFAVILVAKTASVISQGGSSLLVSADRQNTVLAIVIVCGALKIGLDIGLIGAYGLAGALAAYAIATIVTAWALIHAAMRASGARLPWRRLGRIGVAGALAAAVAAPLAWVGDPLLAALTGGVAVCIVYALGTLVLGCWTEADIAYLARIHEHIAGSRPAPAARLLAWAGRRAAKET